MRDNLSDPPSSDSDFPNSVDYRCKQYNKKRDWKTDPIKSCAHLMAKLLMTSYKSKTIKFKLDEDLIQRQICFLTFVESLAMMFSQYTKNCEVLIDYPKIGGEYFKEFAKKYIWHFCMQILTSTAEG